MVGWILMIFANRTAGRLQKANAIHRINQRTNSPAVSHWGPNIQVTIVGAHRNRTRDGPNSQGNEYRRDFDIERRQSATTLVGFGGLLKENLAKRLQNQAHGCLDNSCAKRGMHRRLQFHRNVSAAEQAYLPTGRSGHSGTPNILGSPCTRSPVVSSGPSEHEFRRPRG